MRHFLSLLDLDVETVKGLVDRGREFRRAKSATTGRLDGLIVGLLFRGSSTRTRSSFAAATLKLGGSIMQYGVADLQMVTGESARDTGRVLAGYINALVVRTNGSDSELRDLADQDQMAVINAMSETEHPSQAICDLITIADTVGPPSQCHVVYLGEGNNTAAALAFAASLTPGMRLTLLTPDGYGLRPETLENAQTVCRKTGSNVVEYHDMAALPDDADVIYTTRWQTMGVPHTAVDWRDKFQPFRVTEDVFRRAAAGRHAVLMHDLPAMRGEDVAASVLDGERSAAWIQAANKLWAAMAILAFCLGCILACNVAPLTARTTGTSSQIWPLISWWAL